MKEYYLTNNYELIEASKSIFDRLQPYYRYDLIGISEKESLLLSSSSKEIITKIDNHIAKKLLSLRKELIRNINNYTVTSNSIANSKRDKLLPFFQRIVEMGWRYDIDMKKAKDQFKNQMYFILKNSQRNICEYSGSLEQIHYFNVFDFDDVNPKEISCSENELFQITEEDFGNLKLIQRKIANSKLNIRLIVDNILKLDAFGIELT